MSWEEISHFGISEGNMRVVVFSQTGLKTYIFQIDDVAESSEFQKLLAMQQSKMVRVSREKLFAPQYTCGYA